MAHYRPFTLLTSVLGDGIYTRHFKINTSKTELRIALLLLNQMRETKIKKMEYLLCHLMNAPRPHSQALKAAVLEK